MAYLTIDGYDFSPYVNKLKVGVKHNYVAGVASTGLTQAKYKSTSYIVEAGIIPVDSNAMKALQAILNKFAMTVSFLDPATNELKTITCILPQYAVEYYTIQQGNVKFQAFAITFTEAQTRAPVVNPDSGGSGSGSGDSGSTGDGDDVIYDGGAI